MVKGGEGWGGGGRRKGKRKGVKDEWNEGRGWVGGGRRDATSSTLLICYFS